MDFNFPHGPQKIEILKKLDPLHVKLSKKFHLKKLRNGRVMACNVILAQSIEKWLSSRPIEIVHALHGIMQCCRFTVFYVDLIFYNLRVIMPNFSLVR